MYRIRVSNLELMFDRMMWLIMRGQFLGQDWPMEVRFQVESTHYDSSGTPSWAVHEFSITVRNLFVDQFQNPQDRIVTPTHSYNQVEKLF